ncbi:hypothetical protein J6590_000963 [Homalodisca vitripennis]|nr:hypothetical protein J6590_000963 [Homalodisca vitripennis]
MYVTAVGDFQKFLVYKATRPLVTRLEYYRFGQRSVVRSVMVLPVSMVPPPFHSGLGCKKQDTVKITADGMKSILECTMDTRTITLLTYGPPELYVDGTSHGDLRYHGPTAIPHVLHDGHIADTHEVAAAKSAHLAALATQSHSHGYEGIYGYSGDDEHPSSLGDLRYHGPTIPHVLHDGHIADTHEVAAAKSAHLAALATQSHSHGYGASYGYSGDEHSSSLGDLRYHGPTAIPHVLHDGHIADTHEVAAAKSAHLAALATQSHSHGYGASYGYSGDEHSSSLGDLRYHGPTAIPHVLHDGHIADTHEVAAAKVEHFAAVAKAKAHAGYGQDYNGRYAEHSGAYSRNSHHNAPYHGPLTKAVVLKTGYLADTQEVATAKQNNMHLLHSNYNYHQ